MPKLSNIQRHNLGRLKQCNNTNEKMIYDTDYSLFAKLPSSKSDLK